jgi:hypothetical protein
MLQAALEAMREREDALLTVHDIEDALERKRGAIVALEEAASRAMGDATRDRKLTGLRNDLAALDAALSSANTEYERVRSRNASELDRWKAERAHDFLRLGRAYCQVTALYGERLAGVWGTVAADLEGESR